MLNPGYPQNQIKMQMQMLVNVIKSQPPEGHLFETGVPQFFPGQVPCADSRVRISDIFFALERTRKEQAYKKKKQIEAIQL